MQLMTVGSKWELVLPPELGYGDSSKKGIPAASVMVFTLEMLSCEGVFSGDRVKDQLQDTRDTDKSKQRTAATTSLKSRLLVAAAFSMLLIGSVCGAALWFQPWRRGRRKA